MYLQWNVHRGNKEGEKKIMFKGNHPKKQSVGYNILKNRVQTVFNLPFSLQYLYMMLSCKAGLARVIIHLLPTWFQTSSVGVSLPWFNVSMYSLSPFAGIIQNYAAFWSWGCFGYNQLSCDGFLWSTGKVKECIYLKYNLRPCVS